MNGSRLEGPPVRLIVILDALVALTVKAPVVVKAPAVTGSTTRTELLAKVADLAAPSPLSVPAAETFRSELPMEPSRFRPPATTLVGPE